ncbi:TPA: hypothetical protein RG687_001871 [Vibrio parahaemolyticus]|nr:hypothetical protein [Vibrio parahaemolyticus]
MITLQFLQKQKKSPLPRFQKNKSDKMLYIIVRGPELINGSSNATHVTLIKLPSTALSSPRSIKHLIAKYGTEEAQELHQGLYRIKTRLDAATFPAVLFNDYVFSPDDSNKLQAIKGKRKAISSVSDASSIKRFTPHASTLTPFDYKPKPKKAGEDAQKLIAYLAKAEANIN